MAKDFIGYEALADRALRGVVKEALKRVQKQGLIGSHHFYITFKTHDPGVEIPDFLKERYPDEMTIVMQNQFSGLHVSDDAFEITLSFQKLPATLFIPFSALTAFVDPAVQFGLQFKNSSGAQAGATAGKDAAKPAEISAAPETAPAEPQQPAKPEAPAASPQVVSLDRFRKK